MPDEPVPDEDLAPSDPVSSTEILNPRGEPASTSDASPQSRSVKIQYSAVHDGPLPPPEHIRQMAQIYPTAPKIIFDDFQQQAKHRRELEKQVTQTQITLAYRGQLIGAAIGTIGIIGSLVVIGLGHDTAGTVFAGGCLLSMVYVFVSGRQEEKKERVEKKSIQEKIRRHDSIEDIEPPQ